MELVFGWCDNIKSCKKVRDDYTNASLQYEFIVFAKSVQWDKAYFVMDDTLVDDRRIDFLSVCWIYDNCITNSEDWSEKYAKFYARNDISKIHKKSINRNRCRRKIRLISVSNRYHHHIYHEISYKFN